MIMTSPHPHHDHSAPDAARRRRSTTPFQQHVIEMILTMVLPLGAFVLLARVALPAAGYTLPSWVLLPVSLVLMVVPMSAWMRHRHHAWRDVVEMNLAMFAGMLVALPVIRLAFPGVWGAPERVLPIMLVAMTVPMVILMLVRRERYEHSAHAT